MTGNQSFYSFAALLIPTLLLGGVLVDRWRPPRAAKDRHSVVGFFVVAVLLFALYAEVQAINAAIVGNPTADARAVIITAVLGSTVAVVLTIAWPWLAVMGSRAQIVVAAAAIALGVSSFSLLEGAIKLNSIRHARDVLEETQGQFEALVTKMGRDERALYSAGIRVARRFGAEGHLNSAHLQEAKEAMKPYTNRVKHDEELLHLLREEEKLRVEES
jgi:hypothetical protein